MRLSADGKACDINAVILQHDENRQIEIIIRLPKVNKHREQEHAERGSIHVDGVNTRTNLLAQNLPADKDIADIKCTKRKLMLLYRILEALMAKYERIIMRHYCSPFYGSQLSDLSNKHIEQYYTDHG